MHTDMKYIFYFECFGKKSIEINAINFRSARYEFFNKTSDLQYCKLNAVHEIDTNNNLIKIYH